jgi:hypothetical protein
MQPIFMGRTLAGRPFLVLVETVLFWKDKRALALHFCHLQAKVSNKRRNITESNAKLSGNKLLRKADQRPLKATTRFRVPYALPKFTLAIPVRARNR